MNGPNINIGKDDTLTYKVYEHIHDMFIKDDKVQYINNVFYTDDKYLSVIKSNGYIINNIDDMPKDIVKDIYMNVL